MMKIGTFTVLLLFCSATAFAQDRSINLYEMPVREETTQPVSAYPGLNMDKGQSAKDGNKENFKERLITANKVHKYLGIGSIALAGMTLLAPKKKGDSLHHKFGQGAAVLGTGAVATGLVWHYEDIHLKNGIKDPDNLHALLGSLGALGFIMAVNAAPDSPHPTYGGGGAVSMLAAIKINW